VAGPTALSRLGLFILRLGFQPSWSANRRDLRCNDAELQGTARQGVRLARLWKSRHRFDIIEENGILRRDVMPISLLSRKRFVLSLHRVIPHSICASVASCAGCEVTPCKCRSSLRCAGASFVNVRSFVVVPWERFLHSSGVGLPVLFLIGCLWRVPGLRGWHFGPGSHRSGWSRGRTLRALLIHSDSLVGARATLETVSAVSRRSSSSLTRLSFSVSASFRSFAYSPDRARRARDQCRWWVE
jgi:hypothetical protein